MIIKYTLHYTYSRKEQHFYLQDISGMLLIFCIMQTMAFYSIFYFKHTGGIQTGLYGSKSQSLLVRIHNYCFLNWSNVTNVFTHSLKICGSLETK